MCIWAYMLIYVRVQVCKARLCQCVGACAYIHVCLNVCVCCVCAGRPMHHCAGATTEPPSPPTHHNKEQLNAAALPAEEPTASHTSTNRQICLKPKERSNKSQPTESNPLQSPSADSNQKADWLDSPYHSLSLFKPHYHEMCTFTCNT